VPVKRRRCPRQLVLASRKRIEVVSKTGQISAITTKASSPATREASLAIEYSIASSTTSR